MRIKKGNESALTTNEGELELTSDMSAESLSKSDLEADKAVETLNQKYEEISNRAIEADLFFSPQKLALGRAHADAIRLAQELRGSKDESEKERLLIELKKKMGEMVDPISHALDKEIELHKKGELTESLRGTKKEERVKQHTQLGELVTEIESTFEIPQPISVEEKSDPLELAAARKQRREARAEEFAEKYGISDIRNAMLVAEQEYQQTIAENQKKLIRNPWKSVPIAVQNRYDMARLKWLDSIEAIKRNPDLSKEEKLRAQVIGKRDAVLREEEARQSAYLEGADHRSKSAIGNALNWAGVHALALPKAYVGLFNKIGTGLAAVQGKYTKNEEYNAEAAARKYARATRILGTAALTTAVLGPILSLGLPLTILFKATRGTLGLVGGAGLGTLSGKMYKKTIGVNRREDLREANRSRLFSREDLRFAEKAQRKGSVTAREKERTLFELLGTLAGGGIVNLGATAIPLHTDLGVLHAAGKQITETQEQLSGSAPKYPPLVENSSEASPTSNQIESAPSSQPPPVIAENSAETAEVPTPKADVTAKPSVDTSPTAHASSHTRVQHEPRVRIKTSPVEVATPSTAPYESPYAGKNIKLPDGIDPNSTEASDFYTKAYNHSAEQPAQDLTQPAAPEPAAPVEAAPTPTPEATPAEAPASSPDTVPQEPPAAPIEHTPPVEDSVPAEPTSPVPPVETGTSPIPEHASGSDITVSGQPNELVVGGQRIDLRVPHIVESNVKKGAHVLIGGTPESRFQFAQEYLSRPEIKNEVLYTQTETNPDPITGKPFVTQLSLDKNGVLHVAPKLQSKYGSFLGLFGKTKFDTIPDPSTFTKVIT